MTTKTTLDNSFFQFLKKWIVKRNFVLVLYFRSSAVLIWNSFSCWIQFLSPAEFLFSSEFKIYILNSLFQVNDNFESQWFKIVINLEQRTQNVNFSYKMDLPNFSCNISRVNQMASLKSSINPSSPLETTIAGC